jgi:RND family efflux transporter MFP subunit
MNTNSILLSLAIALLAFSCRSPETPLDKLIAERDSLRAVQTELESHISEVETEIAKRDTTLENKLVTTYSTQQKTFKHYFEVYGNVESEKAATLFAENPGNVTELVVEEGESVSKGQVLIKLDTEIANKNIQELQTSLDLATTLFKKQKRLWEQNIGSEVQYLEAKNRKESLENSLATAREQRSKSTIRAPFAGVVDKIFPKVGEMAGPQSPMVRMVNLENLYITADVTERYINEIKKGDEVSVVVGKDTVQSSITRIGDFINPTNRSFEIRVNISDTLKLLRPNSLVKMKINDFTRNEAVIIPSSVIMQDAAGDDYIFVTERKGENGQRVARRRKISTGASYEGKTLINTGLKPNEEIIDKGARSVRDGDRIEVTKI